MKVLAIVLLCAVAAVQGRSAGVKDDHPEQPNLGDVPYVVHLRVAIGTSGLLQTGVGSLISERWVLTAASAVFDSRFIWNRIGLVEVPRPRLVIESNAVTRNAGYDAATGDNNLALINLNRIVEFTRFYSSVAGIGGVPNQNEVWYGFGQDASGNPGVRLQRFTLNLEEEEESALSAQGPISAFDVGAPIVSDGRQVALLSGVNSEGGAQLLLLNDYVSWVNEATGLELGPSKA